MTLTNHIRLGRAAMLAAIIAVFVGPNPAFGKAMPGPVPDAFERYVAAHPYGQGVIDTSQAPDAFERYVRSHSSTSAAPLDGRSSDTRDAADTAQLQITDGRSPDTLDAARNAQLEVLDGRSPDTRDAARTIQPVEIVTFGRFDWSDAGIGAAGGAGLILLLGMSMLLLRRMVRRHNIQAT